MKFLWLWFLFSCIMMCACRRDFIRKSSKKQAFCMFSKGINPSIAYHGHWMWIFDPLWILCVYTNTAYRLEDQQLNYWSVHTHFDLFFLYFVCRIKGHICCRNWKLMVKNLTRSWESPSNTLRYTIRGYRKRRSTWLNMDTRNQVT